MDEEIIERYNSVVTDADIVYHLGDFCWKTYPDTYLNRLKGKEHHFIFGNHDKKQLCRNVFTSAQDVKLLNIQGLPAIWLSHYNHRVWPQSHYGSIHLFGHSHGTLKLPEDDKAMDVGVDCLDYYPISLDDIIVRMKIVDKRPIE